MSLTIPSFTLPSFIARLGNRLPQWPHAVALTTGLNAIVKMKLLPDDSLALLEGKNFLIDVLDTGGQAAFTFRDGLFRPLFTAPETPDLAFRANLSAFLQLAARQEDPDTLFFNRTLSIEGDTELGLIVKNMLDAMEWPKFAGIPAFRH
ncbi:ubiquinone anaerobic biosynthesis accessory factor UbiT [Propionivibrio sp.]|uniref:ubiquinone anaerobic biosynthesis accessory factor UbiT n=1 Tax=Propionivibrio sp. TaxID=2212460 RepID=UPI00272E1C23|nr:SCP2 sterol-binding domain-containing protein [Propionivibrio sp.]